MRLEWENGSVAMARGRSAQAVAGNVTTAVRLTLLRADLVLKRWGRWSVAPCSEHEGGSSVKAQKALPFRQCLGRYWYCSYLPLEDNQAFLERSRALLKRWLDHPDAEKIWDTIRAHSEQHSGPVGVDAPSQFIYFILKTKLAAEKESGETQNLLPTSVRSRKRKLNSEVSSFKMLRNCHFTGYLNSWKKRENDFENDARKRLPRLFPHPGFVAI
jgi:hypothetical protein